MPLSNEERQQLLGIQKMNGGSVSSSPQRESLFGSKGSRLALPMAGMIAGESAFGGPSTAAGMALGTAIMPGLGTAIGGVGGALLPGILGGMAGEATRQVGQGLETGQSLQPSEQWKQLGDTAMQSAQGTALGAGLAGVGRLASKALPQVGRLAGVPARVTERAMERGSTNILHPEFEGGMPRPLSEKVQSGIKMFTQRAGQIYDNTVSKLRPQMEMKYVSVQKPLSTFRDELVGSNVVSDIPMTKTGRLSPKTIQEFSQGEGKVSKVLHEFNSKIKTGGQVTALESQRLVRKIDDLVTWGKQGVLKIGDKQSAMLKTLRNSLADETSKMIPRLSKANEAYSNAMRTFSEVQPWFGNQKSVPASARALMERPNELPLEALQRIDNLLPHQFKFLDAMKDYSAGSKLLHVEPSSNIPPFNMIRPGLRAGQRGLIKGNEAVKRLIRGKVGSTIKAGVSGAGFGMAQSAKNSED